LKLPAFPGIIFSLLVNTEVAMMSFKGHVQNGVVVLDEPASLPEGSEVRVELADIEEQLASLREGLLKFSGIVDDLPEDWSENHDFYLYGTPRE
jgi:predicted DNA-binding antitoxin AbrB/MazE fold protein